MEYFATKLFARAQKNQGINNRYICGRKATTIYFETIKNSSFFVYFSAFCYICYMKNVVFDLGRVVFAQDPTKSTAEFKQFFSYVSLTPMPQFWTDYDMGILTFDQVAEALAEYRGVEKEFTRNMISLAIGKQESIRPTAKLIGELKAAGYKLYVLSNMSREFIDFLRKQEVYQNFDGDVVSCEVGVVKPMPEIYDLLLERFELNPAETIFIDDREENIKAAEKKGITGFHFDRNDYEGSCQKLRKILL